MAVEIQRGSVAIKQVSDPKTFHLRNLLMTQGFRFYSLGLIVTIVCLAVTEHAQADMYKGYETPPYELIALDGSIELRRYEPHVVAEVTVEGSREEAIHRGFRTLAGFMFGANETGQSVKKEVPVSKFSEGDDWTIRFLMPAAYIIASLPKPTSDSIRFVETQQEDQLVLRFSGIPTAKKLAETSLQLAAYARAKGYSKVGEPRFHFYDDPFALPWKRRNEVSVPVS